MPSSPVESTSSLQLGFVGGGVSSSIGPTHFSASQLDGRWKLVSGYFSRNPETSLATAKEWNLDKDRAYPTLEKFIEAEKGRLDAVAVLAPTPDHKEIVLKLIQNGFSVICEKPLVATLDEALDIEREVASMTSSFLAVTFNYSGYPMVRELRERIRQGEFGDIVNIQFEMPQEGFMRLDPASGKLAKPHGWRLVDGEIPVICLDLGVHLHHLAYFLTGQTVARVAAEFSTHSIHQEIIDDVMMWLDYREGMKGSFWFSKSALGHRNGLRLRLYGSKAGAMWLQSQPEEMTISYADGRILTVDRGSKGFMSSARRYNRYRAGHPSGFIEAFANLYDDIADAIQAGRAGDGNDNPYVFGIEHSIQGLKLFKKAVEANTAKTWLSVT